MLTAADIKRGRAYRAKQPKSAGQFNQYVNDRQVLFISSNKNIIYKGKHPILTDEYKAWLKQKRETNLEYRYKLERQESLMMEYEDETKLPCVMWDYAVQYDSPSMKLGQKYPTIALSKFIEWAGADVTDTLPKEEWESWDTFIQSKKHEPV